MDTLQPVHFLLPERPLLGAMAVVACLAGGTATRNMAATVLPLSSPAFAAGWNQGASHNPGASLAAVKSGLLATPAAVPSALESRRMDVRPDVRLTAATRPSLSDNALTNKDKITAKVHQDAPVILPAASTPTALVAPVAMVAPLDTRALGPAALVPQGAAPSVAPAALVQPARQGTMPRPGDGAGPAARAAADAPLKLLASPELKRFDLARYRGSVGREAANLAASAPKKSAAMAGQAAKPRARLIDGTVYHEATVRIAGQDSGGIAVRIGPDMKPSVKLGDLLGLVSAQMNPDDLARFSAAASAGDYVSFATLRSAGFTVDYNAAADTIAISLDS